jgi:hypothetical protein
MQIRISVVDVEAFLPQSLVRALRIVFGIEYAVLVCQLKLELHAGDVLHFVVKAGDARLLCQAQIVAP